MQFLRDLAEKTGTSFAYPATSAQAHREIERMLALPRARGGERRRERRALGDDIRRLSGGASRVEDHELAGYGSEARWLHHTQD